MKYLLDTNALIYLQGGKLADGLPVGTYAYSVISEIELLSWPEMQPGQELVWRGMLASLIVSKLMRPCVKQPSVCAASGV